MTLSALTLDRLSDVSWLLGVGGFGLIAFGERMKGRLALAGLALVGVATLVLLATVALGWA